MDIVDLDQAESFLRENALPSPFEAREETNLTLLHFHFEQEDHTRSLYPVARFVESLLSESGVVLGVVNRMQVWESGTDPHLVSLVLADCFGKKRNEFSNGCKFMWTPMERQSAISLIHLAMLFGWDMYLQPKNRNLTVFISHDGFFRVFLTIDQESIAKRFTSETGRIFEVRK